MVGEFNDLLRDFATSATQRRAATSKLFAFAAPLLLALLGLATFAGWSLYARFSNRALDHTPEVIASVVARQIICAESKGDSSLKNKRSSASGAAQFIDQTWLWMVRTYRRDLAQVGDKEVLQLRHDAKLAGEITLRLVERNAEILKRRELPVTPATLYLAHFAGDGGAVALLLAADTDDAASVIARADSTRQSKREKLVKGNPFLGSFTVRDLKNWAEKKMQRDPTTCLSPQDK